MTKKRISYILAAVIISILAYYAFQIIESNVNARRAENAINMRHQLTITTNPVHYSDTDLVAMLYLQDMQGYPIKADITAQLAENENHMLHPFSTDYEGSALIAIPLHNLENNRYTLALSVTSELGRESFEKQLSISQADTQNLIINFDKGLYKPGDDVLFRILALNSINTQPLAGNVYTISIFDGNDNRVFREDAKTSDFGIISGHFRLASEVNSGFYRLLVERDGIFQAETFFEVSPYVLPQFEITLSTDKREYSLGETIYLSGEARYFFDEPVNQATVTVYINGEALLTREPIDEYGQFNLSYATSSVGRHNIWVEVIDNSNHRIESSLIVLVSEEAFVVELMPEHGDLIYGKANTVYIFTNRAGGAPTRAFLQISGRGFSRQVATDDNGMGAFILDDAIRGANEIFVRAEDMDGNVLEQYFDFNGVLRNVSISTNKPRYAMGETIYMNLHSQERGGTFIIYAYRNDRLLQILTTDTDRAELNLGDAYGLIDIYAQWMTPDNRSFRPYARRTIFVDPGSAMHINITSDRPEYRPGEFVNLSIGVTDDKGTPLEAALLVNIVDEAVLSLAANDLSIDNIRLALEDIRFDDDLDAATLYTALIGQASEQTLTRLMLRQGDAWPLTQTTVLINEPPATRYRATGTSQFIINFFLIYTLAATSIVFFMLRYSIKKSSTGQVLGKERAVTWTVIATIILFFFILIFLSSCGAADNTAESEAAPAPVAEAAESPEFERDAPAMPMQPLPAAEEFFAAEEAESIDFFDEASLEVSDNPAEVQVDAPIETQAARVRRLFLETMLFVPELIARDGQANLDFMLADNITTWNIQVVGNTKDGLIGHAESGIRVFQPFFVDFELPRNSIRYDSISVPVTVFNYTEQEQTVVLTIAQMDWFYLHVDPIQELTIPSNRSQMVYIPITILDFGNFVFRAYADTHGFADAAERPIRVSPEGFRIERVVSSGSIENSTWQHILFMEENIADTRSAHTKFYPSSMSKLIEGMENIFRMPTGCFEQISSTLYPNILALRYMQVNNIDNPALTQTALGFISSGVQQLLTYEVRQEPGGFSLYGHAPAETVLTAYGLMQLKDLSSVYPVDERVLDRMADFLFDSQNRDGSFNIQGRNMNRLSERERLAFNAYITWSLSATFPDDYRIYDSVNYLISRLDIVDDNYTLALIANALVNTNNPLAEDVLDQLQDNITRVEEGAYLITTSRDFLGTRGHAQDLQATALASLAFSNNDSYRTTNELMINYIISQRDPWGTWHSTQATILCLKALIHFDQGNPLEDGIITVRIGDEAQDIKIIADNTLDFYQVTFNDLERENIVDINFPNLGRMTYKITIEYYAPYDAVELNRGFEIIASMNTELEVHQLVEQDILIINTSGYFVDNALAAISIPQGFRVEMGSLAALRQQGLIERYETRFDNINLYLRDVEPGEIIILNISYRPSFPAEITGGHMRVFDYYNPTVEGFLVPFKIVVR